MTTLAKRFAAAAREMVGTPFRLHGREPGSGLDCVGLVSAALEMAGNPHVAPEGYSLRNLNPESFMPLLEQAGFTATDAAIAAGDVVMVRPGPGQLHLLIAGTASSFVHAHAGLRRVVETPAPLQWPLLGNWRLIAN